jgi:hypothetical protein
VEEVVIVTLVDAPEANVMDAVPVEEKTVVAIWPTAIGAMLIGSEAPLTFVTVKMLVIVRAEGTVPKLSWSVFASPVAIFVVVPGWTADPGVIV